MRTIQYTIPILLILSMGLFFSQCERADGPVQPIIDAVSKVPSFELIEGAENVTAQVNNNRVTSYFTFELSDIKPNPFISNGVYEGWCTLWDIPIQRGTEYRGVKLYSTKGEKEWNKLNYLLYKRDHYLNNFNGATWKELQVTIWSLIEFHEFDLETINVRHLPSEFRQGDEYAFDVEIVGKILDDVQKNTDTNAGNVDFGHAIFVETESDVQNGLIYIDPVKLLEPENEQTDVSTDPLLQWTQSAQAEFYQLQVSTESDLSDPVFDEDEITETSQQLMGLDFETTYYWRVRALKADTASPWTSIWSFTTEIEEEELPYIVSISPVDDVSVPFGTSESDAIAELADETTIEDSDGGTHTVSLSWTIQNYDGNTAGDYNATGTFDLPAGVEQSDPPTDLEVSATVTVEEEDILQFSIPITVSDGVNDITLIIGVDPDGAIVETSLDEVAPPPPPAGGFDARILVGGEDYLTKYLDNTLTDKEFIINTRPEFGVDEVITDKSIVLSWDNDDLPDVFNFIINDNFGGDADMRTVDQFEPVITTFLPGSSVIIKFEVKN